MGEEQYRSGIFVSYAHNDKSWLDRLRVHLKPHLQGEKLDLWDDTRIAPGDEWEPQILDAIRRARVAVLLVSPDLLASDYVTKVELPAILERSGKDLVVVWIPIRPSAYDATQLKAIQAAHDPRRPLDSLSPSEVDQAFVVIAKKIVGAMEVNAVANALRIIDDFEPQIRALKEGRPEPETGVVHSVRAEQTGDSIQLIDPGGTQSLITADELEQLDSNSRKLIRSYERTMKVLFEKWTELKPKRYADDPEIRRETREKSEEVRRDLCQELQQLLSFIESLGKSLMDHYTHVRHICSGN